MTRRFRAVALALVAGLSIAAAGCGDSNDSTTAASPPAMPHDAMAADSGASTLRAALTGLLTDHVYLAGIAINTGITSGLDSGAFKAAAGTLDKNSVALSKAIESVYGADAGTQFLALWRAHIGFFVDYTKAKASGDTAGATAARKKLDGYRQDFGAFIASANPNLPKAAVAAELKPHVTSVIAVIDAAVAKSPTTFDKLEVAARHMPMTAKVLAGGIAKQFPTKFSGSVDAGASELRATLTALLESHVYLAGVAVATGVASGLDSAAFKAAAGTLDKNSIDLSKAIESVYGAPAGKQFLALWRAHIGFFVEYTKAQATRNAAGSRKALAKLDGYRNDFGAFIASANPNLPKQAVADELKPHIATLAAAIRAAVKKSPKTFDRLAQAAAHMPMTADILAGGIAKQFPTRFPAS
jgi:hypothetical protein